ncbi:hypothetical protein T440DRAFT_534405 [Plenodomus tracheiphilus IPT5]|uniref:Pal1-domain-containing protein n=1 Tax=Plenodomus tracheiphilus IPT5 TaxID=1408161 RepID=A0A6A7B3B0_9PLEO|nr:hypothetical protein T440DRAFT_534405 [Plenodomus tracheiphilus IPT5]
MTGSAHHDCDSVQPAPDECRPLVQVEAAPPIPARNPLRGEFYYSREQSRDGALEVPGFGVPSAASRYSQESEHGHDDTPVEYSTATAGAADSSEVRLKDTRVPNHARVTNMHTKAEIDAPGKPSTHATDPSPISGSSSAIDFRPEQLAKAEVKTREGSGLELSYRSSVVDDDARAEAWLARGSRTVSTEHLARYSQDSKRSSHKRTPAVLTFRTSLTEASESTNEITRYGGDRTLSSHRSSADSDDAEANARLGRGSRLSSEKQLSHHSQDSTASSYRRTPTLSLFPPVSTMSGNREYHPAEDPFKRQSTSGSNLNSNLASLLGNGRDAYGNYLTSMPKEYFPSQNLAKSPPGSPTPRKRQTRESLGDLIAKLSPTKAAPNNTALETKQEDQKPAIHLRGGWGTSRQFRKSDNADVSSSENGMNHGDSRRNGMDDAYELDFGKVEDPAQQVPGQRLRAPSLYPTASMSYMRGQQTRTPTPRNSFHELGEAYRAQDSHAIQFNTPYDPYNPPDPLGDHKTAEQQVNDAFEETKRRMGAALQASAPEKTYHIFGPPKMPDPDSESVLTARTADDKFRGLEGLHDSGPYTKFKQRQMYNRIMEDRGRAEKKNQREQRRLEEEGIFNYGIASSVAPGDSISQAGHPGPSHPKYANELSSVPEYHIYKKSHLHRDPENQRAPYPAPDSDVYPRSLVAPPGSVAVIPTSTTNSTAQTPLPNTTSLASKVSRFLLSAPSDPSLKTYSTRLPPPDSAAATTTITKAKPHLLRHIKSRSNIPTSKIKPSSHTRSRFLDILTAAPAATTIRDFADGSSTAVAPILALSITKRSSNSLIHKPSLFSKFGGKAHTTPTTTTISKATISPPLPLVQEEWLESSVTVPSGAGNSNGNGNGNGRYEQSLGEEESGVTIWPGEDDRGILAVRRVRG